MSDDDVRPHSPAAAGGDDGGDGRGAIPATSTLVRAAVADLAGRLGIEEEAVTLVRARAVTWPDASCGCPQPGMVYLQRLVDGAEVILAAVGRRFVYRGGNPLRLCDRSGLVTGLDAVP